MGDLLVPTVTDRQSARSHLGPGVTGVETGKWDKGHQPSQHGFANARDDVAALRQAALAAMLNDQGTQGIC